MIELPDVTIWSMVWTEEQKWTSKVQAVLKYCREIMNPDQVILFTTKPGATLDGIQQIQIPPLNWQSYNIFINRVIPTYIKSGFAMSVHEDGFPIDVSMWSPEFLEYDYIGATWDDGVVGNGGFSIESRKLMDLKSDMPMTAEDFSTPSDRLICTTRKQWLEERGIRFAPAELALKFSTEQVGNDRPSFGFHGRNASREKYKRGLGLLRITPQKIVGGEKTESIKFVGGFWRQGQNIVPPPKAIHTQHIPRIVQATNRPPVRPGFKICITTTFDRNYSLGGKTLMKSIRRYTNCAGIDFKVITDDPVVVKEFGEGNCHFVSEEIKARYANVKYSSELPKERYHTSWYRYELFSFEGYDRVICIDSDCICIEDISFLFSAELDQYDLISVEDHIVSKCFTKSVPYLEAQGLRFDGLRRRLKNRQIDVQPALLVANKSIVNKAWYNRLLKFANESEFTYSIDEGILNDFIYNEGLKIKLLPLEWDYQDLYEIHCPMLPVPNRPNIVHCQESKPFKKDKQNIDPRMHKWHNRWWLEHRAA